MSFVSSSSPNSSRTSPQVKVLTLLPLRHSLFLDITQRFATSIDSASPSRLLPSSAPSYRDTQWAPTKSKASAGSSACHFRSSTDSPMIFVKGVKWDETTFTLGGTVTTDQDDTHPYQMV